MGLIPCTLQDHTVHYDPKPTGFFFVETFQGEDPIDTGRVVKSSADKYVHQMLKVDTPSLYSGIAGDKVCTLRRCTAEYGTVYDVWRMVCACCTPAFHYRVWWLPCLPSTTAPHSRSQRTSLSAPTTISCCSTRCAFSKVSNAVAHT